MIETYQVLNSKQDIQNENEILFFLHQNLSIKEIKKLYGKRCGAWYEEETLGSLRGFELTLKDGNQVFIDTELDSEYVLLYKLFIKNKGRGLGSQILEIYKQYIDSHGGIFMICQVINPEFFKQFNWLSFDGHQTFEYNCKK